MNLLQAYSLLNMITEGGKTSYIKMSIIVDTTEIGKEIQDLLEPQFVAETID